MAYLKQLIVDICSVVNMCNERGRSGWW